MAFYRDHRGPIHIPAQDNLLKGGPVLIFFEKRQKILFVSLHITRKQAQRVFRRLAVFGNKEEIERRPAINQELSLAIKNHPACAGNPFDANAIILGEKRVALALDDLQKAQPSDKPQKRDDQNGI